MLKIKYIIDNTDAETVLKTALRVGFYKFNSFGKATLGRIEDKNGRELAYSIDENNKTATRAVRIMKNWMQFNSVDTVIFELHTQNGLRKMQAYIGGIVREHNIGVANEYEHLSKLPDYEKDLFVRTAEKYIFGNVADLLAAANQGVGLMIENGVDLHNTTDWGLRDNDILSGETGFLSCYHSTQNIEYHVFKNMSFAAKTVEFVN